MVEEKVKNQKSKVKSTTQKSKTLKKVEKAEGAVPVVESVSKTTRKSAGSVSEDLYDAKGKVSGKVDLPKEIFGVTVNKKLIAQAVRVYLANQREGSASTKTRGEVRGSTRKIYRQKGTGRARHGGVRAPIFVHGGVAHGPKPIDFTLSMPQKMKRAALFASLTLKLQNGEVKVIDGLESVEAKTKPMAALLTGLDQNAKKHKILLVLDKKNDNIIRAARNIEGVVYEFANQLNTFEVMSNKTVIFMKSAISAVEETFLKEGGR